MESTKPKNFPEPPKQSLYKVFKDFVEKNKKWFVMFIVSTGLAVVCSWKEPQSAPQAETEIDILIPQGYVLLPIEIENYESLDSILGQMGVVDLYQNQVAKNQRHLVASFVRILRNPHNPSQFSILVPERSVSSITNNFGPYFVSLRPRKNGTDLEENEFKMGVRNSAAPVSDVQYVE